VITLKSGVGLPGRIHQSQRTDWVEDVVKDPNFQRASYAAKVGIRGAFAFPIIVDEEVAYVMEFFSMEVRPREEQLLRMMTVISGQIGQFVSRRRAEAERLSIDARLRQVTESFPGVIYQFHQSKDGKQSFPFISLSVKDLLGSDAEVIQADTKEAFSKILSEDLPKVYDTIRISAITLKPWDHEFRVHTEDSKIKWLRGSAVPSREADGGTLWNGVLTDITEKKEIEEKIIRSNEELKSTQMQLSQAAKMESIGRLAAGIAHEVKNPLAILLMGMDYLTTKASDTGSDIKMVLEDMKSALKRADGVIRGLLDFSTASKLNEEMQDLNILMEGSLIFVKHELMKAHIFVQKELMPSPPLLKLDKAKLEQVFINVFMNAIQAMEEGGTLTLRTKLKKFTAQDEIFKIKPDFFKAGEQYLTAEIDDVGTGIPEDKIHKIYEPFFTTKPTGQGTGLGLCVSKRIVELHNGVIDIRNRPEGGVRCTLYFKIP
jgi:signal transduction histidine kinase